MTLPRVHAKVKLRAGKTKWPRVPTCTPRAQRAGVLRVVVWHDLAPRQTRHLACVLGSHDCTSTPSSCSDHRYKCNSGVVAGNGTGGRGPGNSRQTKFFRCTSPAPTSLFSKRALSQQQSTRWSFPAEQPEQGSTCEHPSDLWSGFNSAEACPCNAPPTL